MKIGLTLSIISISCFTFSQNSLLWQKVIGGSSSDNLTEIQNTIDGGYILGGSSSSDISSEKSENSNGKDDYWVVKLDSIGTIEWQKTIGGNDWDHLQYIEQTSDGGYICGGSSKSGISGDKTMANYGNYDYWIVKLNQNGNIQWQVSLGGDSTDALQQVKQTPDKGFICAGNSRSSKSGNKTEYSAEDDYWIVKLDSLGNIQWQNNFGGTGQDVCRSVEIKNNGEYLCFGHSNSMKSNDKSRDPVGGIQTDYWVVNLDTAGNITWDETIGGSEMEIAWSMDLTKDGGSIIAGYTLSDSSGNKSEDSHGGIDYWVVKLNANGQVSWEKTFGGTAHEMYGDVKADYGNGFIVTCLSESGISGNKTESSRGGGDYWILRLDSIGNIEWQKTIGGAQNEFPMGICQKLNGDYIIGGTSESGITGDKDDILRGISDYWIVKIGVANTASIDIPIISNKNVIYPNPVNDIATIKIDDNLQNTTLTIFNLEGKLIFSKENQSADLITFSASDFPQGTYLYKISANSTAIASGKFIVH